MLSKLNPTIVRSRGSIGHNSVVLVKLFGGRVDMPEA